MSTKQRMSILRLSTSSGRSMYFCTIHPAFLRLFQSRNYGQSNILLQLNLVSKRSFIQGENHIDGTSPSR
jgi:hypothetical protein